MSFSSSARDGNAGNPNCRSPYLHPRVKGLLRRSAATNCAEVDVVSLRRAVEVHAEDLLLLLDALTDAITAQRSIHARPAG